MKTIWKYVLKEEIEQKIKMPGDAVILCVKNQHEKAVLYVLHDSKYTEAMTKQVIIYLFATGYETDLMDITMRYLDTLLFDNGEHVFHVFCKGE